MANEGQPSSYLNPVILLAGVIGLIQSVIWFVLSLLAILAHRCVLGVADDADKFTKALVQMYFADSECPVKGATPVGPTALNVSPTYLHGWMAAYLAMNIFYFFASFDMLWYRNKGGNALNNWMRAWSALTLGFLVMDLTLTIQFGQDYDVVTIQSAATPDQAWLNAVPGALFAIAARGFVLWLLNCIIVIYFFSRVIRWDRLNCSKKPEELDLNDPKVIEAIDKYNRSRVDAAWSSETALVPANYFNSSNRIPRPWDDNSYRAPHPNAVEGVSRFNEDVMEHRPRPVTRPVVWDDLSDTRVTPRPYPTSTFEGRQKDPAAFLEEDNQRRSSYPAKRPATDFSHNIRNFEPGRGGGGVRNGNGNKPFGAPIRTQQQSVKADVNYY